MAIYSVISGPENPHKRGGPIGLRLGHKRDGEEPPGTVPQIGPVRQKQIAQWTLALAAAGVISLVSAVPKDETH